MKRLLLTSKKIDALPKLLSQNAEETKLVFIPTAADPYEDKWFVDTDRKKLKEMGFRFVELDLKGKTPTSLQATLQGAGVVYVAGGNTFYLLQKVKESGFDQVVKPLVEKGMCYVGSSAGAVLAGPSIEPVKAFDDPSVAKGLRSFDGLGLVDFVTLPHAGDKKEQAAQEDVIRECNRRGLKVVPISDEQYIIVEGDEEKIKNSE